MAVPNTVVLKGIDEDSIKQKKETLPRKIRTLPTSFQEMKEKWRKFRVSQLEQKLKDEKQKALDTTFEVNSKYYMPEADPKTDKEIYHISKKITKLESKIKLLKENKKWTKRRIRSREIVLYKNMMDHLRYNTEGAFSFAENITEEEIFGPKTKGNPNVENQNVENPSLETKNTTPAKSVINEDGTYLIHGEDIIDNRWVDNKKVSRNGSSAVQLGKFASVPKEDDLPFSSTVVPEQIFSIPKKEERMVPIVIPERDNNTSIDKKREEIKIMPEVDKFQFTNEETKKIEEEPIAVTDLDKAIDNASSTEEVQEILKRVNALKEENASTKKQVRQATEDTETAKKKFEDMRAQLLDYQAALAEDSDYNRKLVRQQQEEQDRIQRDIQAMMDAMGPVARVSSVEESDIRKGK